MEAGVEGKEGGRAVILMAFGGRRRCEKGDEKGDVSVGGDRYGQATEND